MNREDYNKLQHEAKKQKSEGLKRFAEMYPERFAELQEQAKREYNLPIVRKVTRFDLPGTRALTEEDIDRIVYDPEERHYLIRAADKWGSEHTFFEGLKPSEATNETVLNCLIEKHSRYYPAKILQITPCNCPACIKRHGEAEIPLS